MRSAELSERVIPVESELISRADATLKGGRPGERAAEYPAWIRNFPSARGLQRAKVDRYSVRPQECRFLHQLAVIPGGADLDVEPSGDVRHAGGFNAPHSVVTTVEDYAVVDDIVSEYNDLCLVPVLLIDRAIPLDTVVQPPRLPAQLVVGEAVGREDQGRGPAPVRMGLRLPRVGAYSQRRVTRWRGRCPVEAARAETLRPGVVEQRILGDFPAEVRATPEAGKGPVKAFCIEIDEVGVIQTRIGRHRTKDELATETPHARADLRGMGTRVARAARQRQLSRNEVEVDRSVRGPLLVPAGNVVEEADARRPDVRVARGDGSGYEHSAGCVVMDRKTVRLKL